MNQYHAYYGIWLNTVNCSVFSKNKVRKCGSIATNGLGNQGIEYLSKIIVY